MSFLRLSAGPFFVSLRASVIVFASLALLISCMSLYLFVLARRIFVYCFFDGWLVGRLIGWLVRSLDVCIFVCMI